MSTNPITPIARGFITRVKPINGITPFTYRDGLTYLQVLEALRAYIRDVLVDEFNRVIADLNEQGEQMAVEFDALISQTNAAIDVLLADFVEDYEALENLVTQQIDAVNALITQLEDYYESTDQVITDKIGQLDTKIIEIGGYIVDVNDQLDYVDERLTHIEWLTPGPPTQVVQLGPVPTIADIHPLWTGWPIEYIITQDNTGNRVFNFPESVSGHYDVGRMPGQETRIRLIPDGENSWKVDPFYSLVVDNVSYSVHGARRANIDSSNDYNAFPVAAQRNGVIILAYTKQEDHYGGGDGARILRSTDNAASWSEVSVHRPDPASPTFTPVAITATPAGFVMLLQHSDPQRCYVTRSVDGTVWSAPVQIMHGIGSSLVFVDDGTTDGVLIASRYVGSWGAAPGVHFHRSTDGGVNWVQISTIPQMSGSDDQPLSESSLIHMGGTELMVAIRYNPDESTRNVMFSHSPDLGVTWGSVFGRIAGVSGHPRLTRLPNGEIVTPVRSYLNRGQAAQWGYAISKNRGRTWRVITDMPAEFQLYGEFVVMDSGEVHLFGSHQLSATRANVWRMPVNPTMQIPSEVQDTGWIPLPLSTGVTAISAPYYKMVGQEIVLRGIVDRGEGVDPGPANIGGPLEALARPNFTLRMPLATDSSSSVKANAALEIGPDGILKLVRIGGPAGETSGIVYLSGVRWSARI